MSDYKLVPLPPTPEMVSAAEDAYMPFGDMEIAIRMAILAAPAVQGEPVAWQLRTPEGRVILNKEFPAWADGGDGYKITPLYTTPQPAEQPAEQQPAPDVAGLVEALEEISDPIRFMKERLEEGERLNGMAAVQLAEDASYLRGIARTALAAHRKQGCK